ncbi:Tetratricopeptide repeat protein OS=Kitasatospora aureofaciens OX=1894 GN=GCM10010502_54730 PE=4 SV=1 [Kitasatospora aureofaciens]
MASVYLPMTYRQILYSLRLVAGCRTALLAECEVEAALAAAADAPGGVLLRQRRLSMGAMLVPETQGWDQDAFDNLGAAINSGFPEVVGPAQLVQALMAYRIGDRDLAEFCHREAAHGAVPHAAAQAAFHLGDMLRARGDVAGARAQFAAAARSGDPESRR